MSEPFGEMSSVRLELEGISSSVAVLLVLELISTIVKGKGGGGGGNVF